MSYLDGLQVSIEVLRNQPSAQDSGGQPVANWATVATVNGRIVANTPSEKEGGNRPIQKLAVTVLLDGSADVRSTDRLRADNQTYEILGPPQKRTARSASVHHQSVEARVIA